MWRKPDAKPSLDTPNPAASPMPPRTPTQNAIQPQQPSFERPAATQTPVSYTPAEPLSPVSGDTSRIGAGLKIRGEITGNSDLYLDGEANGKIRVTGARVTIGPKGKVQADVDAKEIVVNGTVQGNLRADAGLRLGSSSHVDGSLAAPSIGIDDGAQFHGKVEVTRGKTTRTASEPEASNDTEPVTTHVEGD